MRILVRAFAAGFMVLCLFACSTRVDVMIVGGGASGVSAGVQAARMGVKTLILEETPWIGGMLTSAGVSCVDGNYNLRGGVFGEFADSLAARYGGWEALKTGWVSHINFEPHIGQEVLTNMTESCGEMLSVKRNVVVKSISGKEGRWKVEVQNQDGSLATYCSKVLIDATELGDVAKECGVEYRIGMEAASDTGESIAPESANDIIQDLTYVAILKDYGPDVDMTIEKPEGYDPTPFYNSAKCQYNTVSETGQTIWPAQQMITYGALPGGKYMINWPIYGNDFYVNTIEMTPEERRAAYEDAKDFTLSFVYFIQTELGMKNLGLADDEFPTEDRMPFFPYHRESRRIVGEAFFTVDAAASPYTFDKAYYRTGIAVGDYAVDHHHFRHPDWKSLPDLHFYPIPSYCVPMGVLLPKNVDGLIVAEKSVSVSNLVNGTTRLQPVVMQLGQAAGALAALSVIEKVPVKEVSVRNVQQALLDAGGYIMPFLDQPLKDPFFQALQRVGATGILRGVGMNAGWSNQTWLRAEDNLKANEVFTYDYYGKNVFEGDAEVSVEEFLAGMTALGAEVPADRQQWWESLGLLGYEADRPILRLEAAVLLDDVLDPFGQFDVDYNGNIIR